MSKKKKGVQEMNDASWQSKLKAAETRFPTPVSPKMLVKPAEEKIAYIAERFREIMVGSRARSQ